MHQMIRRNDASQKIYVEKWVGLVLYNHVKDV